jgi:hypothetical protein
LGCNDIGGENLFHLRQGADEFKGKDMPFFPALDTGFLGPKAIMLKSQDNLTCKVFKKLRSLLTQAVFEVGRIDACAGEVTWEKNTPALMNYTDNCFMGRNGDGAGMVPVILSVPGIGQLPDDKGDFSVQLGDAVRFVFALALLLQIFFAHDG